MYLLSLHQFDSIIPDTRYRVIFKIFSFFCYTADSAAITICYKRKFLIFLYKYVTVGLCLFQLYSRKDVVVKVLALQLFDLNYISLLIRSKNWYKNSFFAYCSILVYSYSNRIPNILVVRHFFVLFQLYPFSY